MLIQNAFSSTFTIQDIPFFYIDAAALIIFIAAWVGYAWYADRNYCREGNLLHTMDDMRLSWMRQMLRRENRIMDSTLIGNLLRSISFFAGTSIFLIIGLFTLLGYREQAIGMIEAIPFAMQPSTLLLEAKVFLMAWIFVYAFFKFTWSLRQYNYACILVGAAPFPNENIGKHEEFAKRAGDLIANAGRHFNMALRAYYFGLATISWFIHSGIFIVMTLWVVLVIFRREFRSHTVNNLSALHNKD